MMFCFGNLRSNLCFSAWLTFCIFSSVLRICLCQNKPTPKNGTNAVRILSDIYRYKYPLRNDLIVDAEDGGLANLKVVLKDKDGRDVTQDSWIQVVYQANQKQYYAYFYISRNLLNTVTDDEVTYLLQATDKDGNTGTMQYIFKFPTKRGIPVYTIRLSLTSISSTVYSSNDVNVLFYVQESKLLTYSVSNNQGVSTAQQWVTESLEINRSSNGQSTIVLVYSAGIFIRSTCNIQDINKMRSKMTGALKATFTQMFLDEFILQGMQEQFNGPCQYLSSDPPKLGNGAINTIDIEAVKYFTYNIPADFFASPTSGDTMKLTMKLRSSNGMSLGVDSWMLLTSTNGYQLQGYLPYDQAAKQTAYQFQLVAQTPILEELFHTLTFNVKNFQTIAKNYVVKFTDSSVMQTQYVLFIQKFRAVMAQYLSEPVSNIFIISYGVVNSRTELSWTLTPFTSTNTNSVDVLKVSKVSSLLYQSNGIPNTTLVNKLSSIGFTLSNINVAAGGSLTTPQIKKQMASLLNLVTFFRYQIPEDAYVDATDGHLLDFKIIPVNSPFDGSNWLTVNSTTRTIYGVPIWNKIVKGQVYTFNLRVTNSLGNYVDDKFKVRSNNEVPAFSYQYIVSLTYSNSATNIVGILWRFFNLLVDYFGDSNRDQLIIKNTITTTATKTTRITFYNSTFRVDPCDTLAIIEANKKFFYSSDPSPELVKFMKVDFFSIVALTSNKRGSCSRNILPYLKMSLLSNVGPHTIKWGQIFKKTIDESLFDDEEDGGTKQLTISLKQIGSNAVMPVNSWVSYNKTTFTVYAVPMSKSFSQTGSKDYVKYILRATDSGGKSVATEYILVLSGYTTPFYKVIMSIYLFDIARLPYTEQLIMIIHKLEAYFGAAYKNKICVISYDVTVTNGNDGTSVLEWTHCDLPKDKCDFKYINEIRKLIYTSDLSQINDQLKVRYGVFQVFAVRDVGDGVCGLSPPKITYQIPPQTVNFCGLFTYQIPNNAFTDKEDGGTKKLSLSMTRQGNLPLGDWMEFDASSQVLSILLTKSMDNFLLSRQNTFVLTATDRSHLSRSQFITINIQGNSDTVDYKKILKFQRSAEFIKSGKKTFIEIARKVGKYFQDYGKSFEAIQASIASDGSLFYEFGNCVIKSSPCDAVAMQNYRQNISQSSFLSIFAPEFVNLTSSDIFDGPCANDNPPKLINQWSTLQVEISRTYTFQVPENTFEDKEQGFTRNLDLELRDIFGRSITSNYWVQFNTASQTITVVATKAIALTLQPSSTVELRLYAYDIKKQFAIMTVRIRISYPVTPFSHFITMRLTVTSKPLERETFTTIYTTLRQKITSYFQDQVKGIISYTTASNTFTTTMKVRWSNSTIATTKCENNKINYMLSKIFSSGVTVNSNFLAALTGSFNVIEVLFSYNGICADERTPPTVANPIPPLKIAYCASIGYRIPSNTFNDRIDGNTRNMVLTLSYLNGTTINKDSLIAFDSSNQELVVTPVSAYFKSMAFPLTLRLKATTARGLYMTTAIKIRIENPPPQYSFYVQVTGQWQGPLYFAKAIRSLQAKTSTYLGYSDSQIHVINTAKQPGNTNLFTAAFTMCSLRYDPCDKTTINTLSLKLKNQNQVNSNYLNALSPDIQLMSLHTFQTGPCSDGDRPPTVMKKIPDVFLNLCSAFKYQMDPNIFQDVEDGNNLSFVLTSLNNQPINEAETWIYGTASKEILATVNNQVLQSSQYKVNVRAYDKKQQSADTTWTINISGRPRKIYYSYKLSFVPRKQLNKKFEDKYKIAAMINSFFGGNVTNIISLVYQNSGAGILFTFASCVLPEYCDQNGARNLQTQLQSQLFRNALASDYTLNKVEMIPQTVCQGPLNPPTPSRTNWDLQVNLCGGLDIQVPETMFTDSEDGNTRKLILRFSTSRYNIVLPDWVRFDSTSQTLYVFPTYGEAKTFQNTVQSYTFTLTATDKSGLSSTITTRFTMVFPQEAKYKFRFQYRSTQLMGIQDRFNFAKGVTNFMGSSLDGFGLYSYSSVIGSRGTTRQIIFANCSISYSPSCDRAALDGIKSKLLDNNNFPRQDFQAAMSSTIILMFGIPIIEAPCTDTFNPPRVINPIPPFVISICNGYRQYVIPPDTFYDPQDGVNLQLSLKTVQGNSLTSQNWVQFTSSTRVVSIYPMVLPYDTQTLVNKHTFTLTATDTSNLGAPTPFIVEVESPTTILKECQIEIQFQTTDAAHSNKIERLSYLNTQLRNFFSFSTNEAIAMVQYIQNTQTSFQLFFSYCSSQYSKSSVQVDYHNFANKILMRLFQTDRKNIVQTFYSAFGSNYKVINVRTRFTGRCSNIPPVVPDNTSPIAFTVSSCGYTQKTVSRRQFYDFENGYSPDLKLELYGSNGTPLSVENWVNFDSESQSIIAVCNDQVRSSTTTTYKYILKATDKNGSSKNIDVSIQKVRQNDQTISPFDITYELQYLGTTNRPMVYQVMYLIQRIKSYYQINTAPAVYLKEYVEIPGFPNYRRITWTTCISTQCNVGGILEKTQNLYDGQVKLKSDFVNVFSPQFDTKRVYYISTKCSIPSEPPYVQQKIPPLKPEYCSIFSYTIPNDMFYDKANGYTNKLKIFLLDGNNNLVPSSSMTQLNQATLQIFSINVESQSARTVEYKLAATNSLKLTTTSRFTVQYSSTPYVVNCPITMEFTYDHLSSTTTDVDVLIKVNNAVTQYYKDKRVMMKIVDFKRSNNNIFMVKWTNCTFQFQTSQQAMNGLVESQRTELTSIFSQVFDSNTKTANSKFTNFISTLGIRLKSMAVSYTCIEKPPVPDSQNEQLEYARYCQRFMKVLPNNLFVDERDGDIRSMTLQLTYMNGTPVSKHEWVQLNTEDKNRQYLYGTVMQNVQQNAVNRVYKYKIICTDTSGRTADKTISITVIPQSQTIFTNVITIGFTSQILSDLPTAYVLSKLTEGLARYQNPSDSNVEIYVRYFDRMSAIQFSYCKLTCSQNSFNTLYSKFQVVKFRTEPSVVLKDALKDDFVVNYVFIDSSLCLPTTGITIIVKSCSPITISMCGAFSQTIPRNCFGDTSGNDARSFLLSMTESGGSAISSSSWIQFDAPSQTVYGTVILDQVISTQMYNIEAKHPSSGTSASNKIEIKVDRYDDSSTVRNEVCRITMQFSDNINYLKKDVEVLQKLMSVIAGFTNNPSSSLMVTQFNRRSNILSVTYTNCTWIEYLRQGISTTTYLQKVNQKLERYFRITQTSVVGITSQLQKHFTDNKYNFISVLTSNGCTHPPNPPPVRNRDLDIELTVRCGIFTYVVPEDTFIDRKYGNTRQLTIEILSENGNDRVSWVGVNSKQEIFGMIDKTVSESKPANGYKFILKATNPVGQSSTTSVTINFPRKTWVSEMFDMSFRTIPGQDAPNLLSYKVTLVNRLQTYEGFKDLCGSFYVKEMAPIGTAFNSIKVSYCGQCNFLNYFLINSLKEPGKQNNLRQWLYPSFDIQGNIMVELASVDLLNKECTGNDHGPPCPSRRELKLCQNNVWNLEETYTELINNYHVMLVTPQDNFLPRSSWINIISNPYRIVAFPTETEWRNQQSTKYQYKIVLKDKNGKTVGTPNIYNFNIVGTPITDGLSYTMTLTTTSTLAAQNHVYLINEIWTLLDNYTGVQSNLQHQSISVTGRTISISWFNCSLKSVCSGDEVTKVRNKFFNGNSIQEEMKTSFLPNYLITGIIEKCSDNPPRVIAEYNITVPICGCFTHKLPDSFAIDAKDGNRLTIELLNQDGQTKLQRSSWITYNAATKSIEAVPEDSTIRQYNKETGFIYMFKVTDTTGKSSMSKLTVHLEGSEVQKYSTYTIDLRSQYPTSTTYVEIKKTLLMNFVKEANGGDPSNGFQIASFSMAEEQNQRFIVKLRNCSVSQYTCPAQYQKLQTVFNNLLGSGKTSFIQRITLLTSGNIIISNIIGDVTTTIDKSPIPANPLTDIQVTYCNNGAFDIPVNTFQDNEQSTFNYKLLHGNGNEVSYTHWVNIVGNTIYVSPLNSSPNGTYTYRLIAYDRCKLQAERSFKVILSGTPQDSPYSLVMQFQLKELPKSYAQAIWNLRKRTQICRNKVQTGNLKLITNMRSEQYVYSNGFMQYRWSDCSLKTNPCVQADLDKLSAVIFSSPNTVSSSFRQCFKPDCNLQQVTELKTKGCKPPSPSPKVKLYPTKFSTTFCRKATFTINPNTFEDASGNNARSMNLELLTDDFNPLPNDEWIQFDSLRQEIYGYPRTGEISTNMKTIYKYKLRATIASTGASSYTDVEIKLLGTPSINFVMVVEGTKDSISNYNIDEEIVLINILKQTMNEQRLNDVSFKRTNKRITFKWSFCQTQDTCNCQKVASFQQSSSTIRQALNKAMTVTSLTNKKYGVCNEGPVQGNEIPKNKVIPVGQCYSIDLPTNLYYDRQDKSNVNLFLKAADGSNLPSDHWLQLELEKSRLCGLVPYKTYTSNSNSYLQNVYKYKIGAQDSCGNQIVNDTQSIIDPTTYTSLEFIIIGIVKENTGEFLGNCSKIDLFLSKVAKYSDYNKTKVLVREVKVINKTFDNITEITWGYRVVNCSNATMTKLYEKFFVGQNEPNPNFISNMRPDFDVATIRDERGGKCKEEPKVSKIIDLNDDTNDFPWWIIWLILCLALLVLLCWLLWICCPRCCPFLGKKTCTWGCCGGICGKCCTKPGAYSSFNGDKPLDIEDGVLSKPIVEDEIYAVPEAQTLSQPKEVIFFDIPPSEDLPVKIEDVDPDIVPGATLPEPSVSGDDDYPDLPPLPQTSALPLTVTSPIPAALPEPSTSSDVLAKPSADALSQPNPTSEALAKKSDSSPQPSLSSTDALPQPIPTSDVFAQPSDVLAQPYSSSDFLAKPSKQPRSKNSDSSGIDMRSETSIKEIESFSAANSATHAFSEGMSSDYRGDNDEVTIETYKDSRPSVRRRDEDVDTRFTNMASRHLPRPLVLQTKSNSYNSGWNRKDYVYADALVDNPIIFKTRKMPRVAVERQRRLSDGDNVVLRNIRRSKSRSEVSSRRRVKQIPLDFRLEERKLFPLESKSQKTRKVRQARKETRLIYRSPSYEDDEIIHLKAPNKSLSQSRSISMRNSGYIDDDFDEVMNPDVRSGQGGRVKRKRASQKIQMESFASGSTTDSGVYDEIIIKPKTKISSQSQSRQYLDKPMAMITTSVSRRRSGPSKSRRDVKTINTFSTSSDVRHGGKNRNSDGFFDEYTDKFRSHGSNGRYGTHDGISDGYFERESRRHVSDGKLKGKNTRRYRERIVTSRYNDSYV